MFKRLFLIFLVLALLTAPAFAYSVPDNTIVYITNTGAKYHREDCSYLKSERPMTISEAEAKGYEPCSRCNPDILTGEYVSNWDGSGGSGSSDGSVGSRSAPENRQGSGYETKTSPLEIVLSVFALLIFLSPLCRLLGWVIDKISYYRGRKR